MEVRESVAQITCEPSDLAQVRDEFSGAGLEPSIVEIIYSPNEYIDVPEEHKEMFEKLLDSLTDNEDVHQVHHNVNE